jgi:hypothetical protein
MAPAGLTNLLTTAGKSLEAGQSPSSILSDMFQGASDVNSYTNPPAVSGGQKLYH